MYRKDPQLPSAHIATPRLSLMQSLPSKRKRLRFPGSRVSARFRRKIPDGSEAVTGAWWFEFQMDLARAHGEMHVHMCRGWVGRPT